ncbi:MAG TPA: trigger factor [Caulobacteraceae bacterium]|nr:trigger factor [Caulobacteraceae bacterium]
MQIVEKSGEGLSRIYGITVPATDLNAKLDRRIAEITPKMSIKGFRPGKVPPAHVRRMYGKELMQEVLQETLNETTQKVLDDNKLRPAGQPDLKLESDAEQVIAGKADLAYELAVEVMPEFELAEVGKLKLKRPTYAPADKEVDEALADLAKQNRTYDTRTGKTVKAKDGDLVVIDFVGRIDGEAFEGGSATDAQLVLGSGQFIPGFEDQLVGAKPGEEKLVKVKFPDDYQAENLKGKDAEFTVTVKEVKAPKDAELNDEFAKQLGLETLDALKEAVRADLSSRYERQSRFKLKRALLDELDKGHDFPLPPRMVDAEFEGIWRQVQADEEREGKAPEDEGKTEDQLKAEYRKIAERRVRLGLVLAEYGRKNEVTVSDQEVTQAMQQEAINMARQYGMQPQQIYDMLRQNPDAAAQIRAPIYEDKVVDLLFGQAKVTDQKVSKDELLKEDDLPEQYGG